MDSNRVVEVLGFEVNFSAFFFLIFLKKISIFLYCFISVTQQLYNVFVPELERRLRQSNHHWNTPLYLCQVKSNFISTGSNTDTVDTLWLAYFASNYKQYGGAFHRWVGP